MEQVLVVDFGGGCGRKMRSYRGRGSKDKRGDGQSAEEDRPAAHCGRSSVEDLPESLVAEADH